jgi:hypothetical protein
MFLKGKHLIRAEMENHSPFLVMIKKVFDPEEIKYFNSWKNG